MLVEGDIITITFVVGDRNWFGGCGRENGSHSCFFFFFVAKAKGAFCLVSTEKEKVELMVREKLISMPWLVSDWQKARHLMAREESVSPTAVILVYF